MQFLQPLMEYPFPGAGVYQRLSSSMLRRSVFTSHGQETGAAEQAGTVSLLSEYREFKFLFPVSFVDQDGKGRILKAFLYQQGCRAARAPSIQQYIKTVIESCWGSRGWLLATVSKTGTAVASSSRQETVSRASSSEVLQVESVTPFPQRRFAGFSGPSHLSSYFSTHVEAAVCKASQQPSNKIMK